MEDNSSAAHLRVHKSLCHLRSLLHKSVSLVLLDRTIFGQVANSLANIALGIVLSLGISTLQSIWNYLILTDCAFLRFLEEMGGSLFGSGEPWDSAEKGTNDILSWLGIDWKEGNGHSFAKWPLLSHHLQRRLGQSFFQWSISPHSDKGVVCLACLIAVSSGNVRVGFFVSTLLLALACRALETGVPCPNCLQMLHHASTLVGRQLKKSWPLLPQAEYRNSSRGHSPDVWPRSEQLPQIRVGQ